MKEQLIKDIIYMVNKIDNPRYLHMIRAFIVGIGNH